MPPRLARLLAIVAAVVLVVGAFALRGALSGDDEEGVTAGSGGGGDQDGSAATGEYKVLCDDDLGRACDRIADLEGVEDVEILRAAEALEVLSGENDFDLWITLDPWPAMLAVGLGQDDPGARDLEPLASATPAVLAYPEDDDDPPPFPGCTTDPTWQCLADSAVAGVDVGMPSASTATGIVLLGHASAGLIPGPELDYGIDAVIEDDVVSDSIDALLDGANAPTARQAPDLVLVRGRYEAVVTIDGIATEVAETNRGLDEGVTVTALPPDAVFGVVAAPVGSRGEEALDRLRGSLTGQDVSDALVDAGWGGDPARSSGLPEPDVMFRLYQEFSR